MTVWKIGREVGPQQAWAAGYATSTAGVHCGDELATLLFDPGTRLADLGGSFAGVAITNGSMKLVSDRFGSMPLYFARAGSGWISSPDYWELVAELPRPTLDARAALDMMAFKYVLGPDTLVDGVSEVPTASTVTLRAASDRPDQHRYWRYDLDPVDRSRRELLSEFAVVAEGMADRSIRAAHLVGIERWGLNLTAGRDSRLIGASLAHAGEDLVCFTSRFPGEVETARAVTDLLGTPHVIIDAWTSADTDAATAIVDALCPTTAYTVAGHPLSLAESGSWPVSGYVSGHLADVLAGCNISLRIKEAADEGRDATTDAIVRWHTDLGPDRLERLVRPSGRDLAQSPTRRLRRLAATAETSTTWGMPTQVHMEHREVRYILRDYQALRSLGPSILWFADHAWSDFWQTVPLGWHLDMALYEAFLRDTLFPRMYAGLRDIPCNGQMLHSRRAPLVQARAADISRRARKKLPHRRRTPVEGWSPPRPALDDTAIELLSAIFDPAAIGSTLTVSESARLACIARVAARIAR